LKEAFTEVNQNRGVEVGLILSIKRDINRGLSEYGGGGGFDVIPQLVL